MVRLAFTVKRETAAVLSGIDPREYSGCMGALDFFCRAGEKKKNPHHADFRYICYSFCLGEYTDFRAAVYRRKAEHFLDIN